MARRHDDKAAVAATAATLALGCAVFILANAAFSFPSAAAPVPLPRPRPIELPPAAPATPENTEPSACQIALSEIAVVKRLPDIAEKDGCAADDVVRLEAVLLPDDKARVRLSQPATLRCAMAQEVAHWIRDDVVPATRVLGKRLRTLHNYDFYVCRTRNGVPAAKLSEHARANALDVHSFDFDGGLVAVLTDPALSKDLREAIRASACARFKTVLGPGSDSFHESHVHLDIIERRGGYRMCQWDVRTPADVPLPRPRPVIASLKTSQ